MLAIQRSRSRRWGLVASIVSMLVLTGSLSMGGPGHAMAQQGPDCEDPETVACLPLDNEAGAATPAPGAAAAAPNTAGAAIAPPVPYPCPPLPMPLIGAAAPDYVAAPYCRPGVFATINRANLAYARSMRALDSSLLSPYWGQDALQGLLGQLAALRQGNSYRVLRLASIQLLEQDIHAGNAWVHTSEHWIWSTWTRGGSQQDSADAWYDNQYFLYTSGGQWVIGTDIVN
jgi:hypothetical protein